MRWYRRSEALITIILAYPVIESVYPTKAQPATGTAIQRLLSGTAAAAQGKALSGVSKAALPAELPADVKSNRPRLQIVENIQNILFSGNKNIKIYLGMRLHIGFQHRHQVFPGLQIILNDHIIAIAQPPKKQC